MATRSSTPVRISGVVFKYCSSPPLFASCLGLDLFDPSSPFIDRRTTCTEPPIELSDSTDSSMFLALYINVLSLASTARIVGPPRANYLFTSTGAFQLHSSTLSLESKPFNGAFKSASTNLPAMACSFTGGIPSSSDTNTVAPSDTLGFLPLRAAAMADEQVALEHWDRAIARRVMPNTFIAHCLQLQQVTLGSLWKLIQISWVIVRATTLQLARICAMVLL